MKDSLIYTCRIMVWYAQSRAYLGGAGETNTHNKQYVLGKNAIRPRKKMSDFLGKMVFSEDIAHKKHLIWNAPRKYRFSTEKLLTKTIFFGISSEKKLFSLKNGIFRGQPNPKFSGREVTLSKFLCVQYSFE